MHCAAAAALAAGAPAVPFRRYEAAAVGLRANAANPTPRWAPARAPPAGAKRPRAAARGGAGPRDDVDEKDDGDGDEDDDIIIIDDSDGEGPHSTARRRPQQPAAAAAATAAPSHTHLTLIRTSARSAAGGLAAAWQAVEQLVNGPKKAEGIRAKVSEALPTAPPRAEGVITIGQGSSALIAVVFGGKGLVEAFRDAAAPGGGDFLVSLLDAVTDARATAGRFLVIVEGLAEALRNAAQERARALDSAASSAKTRLAPDVIARRSLPLSRELIRDAFAHLRVSHGVDFAETHQTGLGVTGTARLIIELAFFVHKAHVND
jgi:hypothetical protein